VSLKKGLHLEGQDPQSADGSWHFPKLPYGKPDAVYKFWLQAKFYREVILANKLCPFSIHTSVIA